MHPHANDSKGCLLLVDDDEYAIKSLARSLRSSCVQVFTALNGEEALKILATQAVDVIVADSLLPPITGIELFRRAKNLFPEIKTVLLSGQSDSIDISQAEREQILQTCLAKPWDSDELVATIREAVASSLQRKRARLAFGRDVMQ